MEKRRVRLPKGTFIDAGSLKVNGHARLTMPDGKTLVTSQVIRYALSGSAVYIETQNSIYIKYGSPARMMHTI